MVHYPLNLNSAAATTIWPFHRFGIDRNAFRFLFLLFFSIRLLNEDRVIRGGRVLQKKFKLVDPFLLNSQFRI